jgi:antitoxin FitA
VSSRVIRCFSEGIKELDVCYQCNHIADMASLIVRNIEPSVVQKLRQRAAHDGVSMEEEHRRILRAVLLAGSRSKMNFKDYLLALPDGGEEAEFSRPRSKMRRIAL